MYIKIISELIFPQSPKMSRHAANKDKEHFSGLWEFFYDSDREDYKRGQRVDRGGEDSKLKSIRGYLFKRRKSPLKGWHKVSFCDAYS